MTISQLFLKVTYTFLRRKLDVQRIRDLREDHDLTQKFVANLFSLSEQTESFV